MQGRIHSVELLEMALNEATRMGYRVREDSLDGCDGGVCHLKGQKWLMLDPSHSSREKLDLVLNALAADSATDAFDVPDLLAHAIQFARSRLS
jgi:hypothetical protein